MFKLIQKFKNKFITKRKINTILDCVEDIDITNDLVTIKLNKNILVKSNQNIILNSDRNIVFKCKTLHMNPDINIVKNIDLYGVSNTINTIIEDIESNNDFIDIGVDLNGVKEICECTKHKETS